MIRIQIMTQCNLTVRAGVNMFTIIFVFLSMFTSVRSFLKCKASEQSTIGTNVTNVDIIWNVTCQIEKL